MHERRVSLLMNERQRSDVLMAVHVDLLTRPQDRLHAVMIEILDGGFADQPAVMVPLEHHIASPADDLEALLGKRSVPDGISQAHDVPPVEFVDLFQDSFEGGEIAVNI